MKNLSLYIHIPFCISKCYYCDFLSAPDTKENIDHYIELLCREIKIKSGKLQEEEKVADTVFFGGGTPSILFPGQITKIMNTLRQEFNVLPETEISLELNPGSVSRGKLEEYMELGINRLSIGLQSANNTELRKLGRIHSWEQFLETWEEIKRIGFSNINIDLMSSLPGQTVRSYKDTLEKVTALKPSHISAYSLIVEEGTKFYSWYGKEGEKKTELPTESEDREMYYMTKRILGGKGYERYEISNYAIPGYECKHNEGYWTGKPYLGLGLGASSYFKEERFQNEDNMESYGKKIQLKEEPVRERQKLSLTEKTEEFMFLGLRRMKGVSEETFQRKFGNSMKQVYGRQLDKLQEQRLIFYDAATKRWALTEKGVDVSNQVFLEFFPDP